MVNSRCLKYRCQVRGIYKLTGSSYWKDAPGKSEGCVEECKLRTKVKSSGRDKNGEESENEWAA